MAAAHDAPRSRPSSDVGRRVAQRREELGLSRADVAERAGIAPQYLRYLEEEAASPTIPSLTRVARALQTTVADLSGVTSPMTLPRPPAGHGEVEELGREECVRLLGAHNVGRVAILTPGGPAIVPVTYTLAEGSIVFRTESGAVPSFVDGEDIAFEVDQLDDALGVGWSVQVVGQATHLAEEEAGGRAAGRPRGEPWARGGGDVRVRVDPARVSGRRVRLG